VEKTRVALQPVDPIDQAGLTRILTAYPAFEILPAARSAAADVLVVVADRLTDARMAVLRRCAAETQARIVLVVDELTESELTTLVECRVVAVLTRSTCTPEQLTNAVAAAASSAEVMPSDLAGELPDHLERLRREVLALRGLNPARLTSREIEILQLMAEGLDTREIASKLSFSERTVKNVLHGITQRLHLRNRAHAVAYALRTGAI
jgi:DNA-binding NarL/FixJ family response regulator